VNLHVYEFCWSPDSRSFAAIAASPPANNNWYIADLYLIHASSGDANKLLSPGMQIAVPRWSPDGSHIAFIGGLISDQIGPSGDIYVLPATGGQPRNLTPGIRISPSWLRWTNESRGLQFVAVESGGLTIGTVDISSSRVTKIWHGEESLSAEYGIVMPNISLSSDGQSSAVVRESFEDPPELWTGLIGKWQQVTHLNSNLNKTWGHSTSVTWRSDSMTIQGWMTTPPNFDSTHAFPMVVYVHGGPADAYWPWWPSDRSLLRTLIGAGYCVFLPNIRGSIGCGESFVRANVRDFGYGDFRDILTGVDAMEKQFLIDHNRVGIIGWSYGGYMAMWAVTQTDRFRACVAGAGIANFLSYYAQNGINRWATSYFGGIVYDDPEIYARSSPINFIKQAKTPTLIVVGEGDRECPAPQAREFWTGLRHVGVKTQLYVYPNAGHGLSSQQRQDFCQRSLRWFNENMR
jgi:dipeptidyl aminopeptidase/acylaminoacyl peptidase